VQIRSIFSFLDRSFLFHSKSCPQLNDMTIKQFRRVICENGQFGTHVYLGMCELIKADRLNLHESFDSALLKCSMMMLHIMDLYKAGFEPVFLQSSKLFFGELNSQSWATISLKTYVSNCTRLLEKEGLRCDMYNLDSSTKRALLMQAQLTLIQNSAERILDKDAIAEILEARHVGTMRELYSLLKASGMQEQLKGPWEDYIKEAGSAIVSDGEKSDDMVVRLLELKRSLEVIIRDSFDKDESFKFAMREAYSSFINDRKNTTAWGTGNSKVGEVIAKYIDMLLRGGLKAVPRSLTSDATDRKEAERLGQASTGDEDAELDRQLEQGIELFRFIEGKDVFEAFYKKDLARRLLMSRSASQDAERNMLTKLKSECGSNFTHNLEQMFKDQELSRDEMASYKQALVDTNRSTVDLQVSVLSAAAWPTYPDIKISLPAEVARHIERFDKYYKQKHTGRRLTWKHALAHSVVKANFPKGTKELSLSGFQAIVLVLFNDIGSDGNISYEDLQSATGLVDTELQRTLQSLACAKFRILNKHPKGREVNRSDTFTVNLNFTDPKYRLKINQIQLKESREENKETHERVALDRQYETQAAIVRIMKSRKVMTHGNLVAEVINQTKSRGAVELVEIKKNIEKYTLPSFLYYKYKMFKGHYAYTLIG
jgi:cullin 4